MTANVSGLMARVTLHPEVHRVLIESHRGCSQERNSIYNLDGRVFSLEVFFAGGHLFPRGYRRGDVLAAGGRVPTPRRPSPPPRVYVVTEAAPPLGGGWFGSRGRGLCSSRPAVLRPRRAFCHGAPTAPTHSAPTLCMLRSRERAAGSGRHLRAPEDTAGCSRTAAPHVGPGGGRVLCLRRTIGGDRCPAEPPQRSMTANRQVSLTSGSDNSE